MIVCMVNNMCLANNNGVVDNEGNICLRYHKCNILNGNFGDELSPIIVSKISGRNIINSASKNIISMVAIGSYIQRAQTNDIIWGSGLRTIDQPANYKNLRVKAVRGPLTKKYLENKNIVVPNVYGDPALLYPILFDINDNINYIDQIGYIPHYTLIDKQIASNIKIISPLDKPENVISQIKSCKYVISSSLHGLILADALNKPNYWLYDTKLNEGTLKFEDYFMSQNRQIKMHNSIDHILKSSSEEYGNKIDLTMLLSSFPKELIL